MIEENFKIKKTYISGKTKGIPAYKIKNKFKIAEDFLKSIGMKPINPLNNGLRGRDNEIKHLTKDLEMLLKSDIIFVLDGWVNSRQSRIEMKVAEEFGITIMFESKSNNNIYKLRNITFAIKEITGLNLEDYITTSRNQQLFYARMILVNYCRNVENMQLQEIAEIINRTHASVLHSLKTFKNEIKLNQDFIKKVQKINNILIKQVSH